MKHLVARPRWALFVPVLAVVFSGCDLVGRYLGGTAGDQLAKAASAQWATPGQPFLDGASGRDTVASVSATGARAWEVAVLPLTGGAPVVWSMEVIRTDVYPTMPGDDFANWLGSRARELGMSGFLPADVTDALRRGDIQAVGDLGVRYGQSDRSGRNTLERVAYLVPEGSGGTPTWSIQPVSRSANVLLEALKTVVDDMARRDDRVMSCMGSGTPRGIARSVQLACVGKAWARDFAADPR